MPETADILLSSDPAKTIQQLTRLVEISLTLNSTLEIDPLLQYILNQAAELLDCEAVSIMLYDGGSAQLYFAAATKPEPGAVSKIPVPLEGSIARTIFASNKPVVLNDIPVDPGQPHRLGEPPQIQIKSLLGVPMQIRQQTIGVLEALNKRAGGFGEIDTKLLSIIASQAAVAIHNARLVQALQGANEELQQADKLKSDFIAIASHELRTPLGIILGYATFLREEAQGELSEHAASVMNAALQLRVLVESMTNMNLLYTGEADLRLRPVEIQKILCRTYSEITPTAEAKNTTLRLEMPQEPVYVNADKKLDLVFVNLLNNAVRFTPNAGEIRVGVEVVDNAVEISISDDGIGIPADKLEVIFEQFVQAEDHMTRRYGGLGLGLAIARALVEKHGGKIWAESQGLGRGATFKVSLPAQKR